MASLLDGIFGFFDGINTWLQNYTISAVINHLNGINDADSLTDYWQGISPTLRTDPGIAAAYKDATARVKKNNNGGFFGSLASDVVNGFDALEADLGKAIAALLS